MSYGGAVPLAESKRGLVSRVRHRTLPDTTHTVFSHIFNEEE